MELEKRATEIADIPNPHQISIHLACTHRLLKRTRFQTDGQSEIALWLF